MSGDGVVSARVEWIASDYTPDCQHAAFYYSMFENSLVAIMRTRRVETAGIWRKQPRKRELVNTDQSQEE